MVGEWNESYPSKRLSGKVNYTIPVKTEKNGQIRRTKTKIFIQDYP